MTDRDRGGRAGTSESRDNHDSAVDDFWMSRRGRVRFNTSGGEITPGKLGLWSRTSSTLQIKSLPSKGGGVMDDFWQHLKQPFSQAGTRGAW